MTCWTSYLSKFFRIFIFLPAVASGALAHATETEVGAMPDPGIIAVLPINNLSRMPAPLKQLRSDMINRLQAYGYSLVSEDVMSHFMEQHRVRYTGGIDAALGQAFHRETGANSVLICDLELYSPDDPPKIALFARLVTTDHAPRILYTSGVALAGDDNPGLLKLGWVSEIGKLQHMAMERLSASLVPSATPSKPRSKAKDRPQSFYRDDNLVIDSTAKIAVLPFVNHSGRRYAGKIAALHVVENLNLSGCARPLEPGVVRNCLLRSRLIMPEGISIDQSAAVFDETDADFIVCGKVLEYEDYSGLWGTCKVNVTMRIISREGQRVVCSSLSDHSGDEGRNCFELGKERTAHGLASKMVAEIIGHLTETK